MQHQLPDAILAEVACTCREAQLALWSQYAAAQQAIAIDQALHSKLGRRPASGQLAAALSLPSPAALASLLADGQVSHVGIGVLC